MPVSTDEEIAKRVQEGDIESFGLIVERYTAKITRYARKFLFSPTDAEDCVQEAFIKVYMNIRSFDTNRKFSSWIYRIAHNEFINAIKKRGRDKISFIDLDIILPHLRAKETADSEVHANETRAMLNTGLEQLSAKYREPLILFYFEEMDYKEISEILKIPVATVGVRLRRGKAMLKNIIAKKDRAS